MAFPNPMTTLEELMREMKEAGYLLMDRHDNPYCMVCSEIVLRWRPGYNV